MANIEHSWCPRCGVLDGPLDAENCNLCLSEDGVPEAVEYVVYAVEHRAAVDLLREIAEMAGAKANGADARAMAKRAREFMASLDRAGGQS